MKTVKSFEEYMELAQSPVEEDVKTQPGSAPVVTGDGNLRPKPTNGPGAGGDTSGNRGKSLRGEIHGDEATTKGKEIPKKGSKEMMGQKSKLS